MRVEKLKFIFIWIFSIIPLSLLLMNITMNTIFGLALHIGDKQIKYSFDIIFVEQISYFSVWTGLITSAWGFSKIINNYKRDNKIKWAESEDFLTMVFTYNFISTLVFSFTLIFATNTVTDFATNYSIFKSFFEHWVIPIIFTFYYFTFRSNSKRNIKTYAKNVAWKNLFFPLLYSFYVISRSVFLNEISGAYLVPSSFPYEQVDPYNIENSAIALVRWLITLSGVIGILFASYFLSVTFELLSLKSSLKLKARFFANDVISFSIKKQKAIF